MTTWETYFCSYVHVKEDSENVRSFLEIDFNYALTKTMNSNNCLIPLGNAELNRGLDMLLFSTLNPISQTYQVQMIVRQEAHGSSIDSIHLAK